jgi:N,N'-diacetyllegionaminate synthase
VRAGVFIIAEAGVNHNGNRALAYQLIEAAAQAGVDAVKFQTFKAERLVSRLAPKAEYQRQTTDPAESQFDMLRKLELPWEWHGELQARARELGLQFLSTPFDFESADFLEQLDIPAFKLPSGEVTNLPFLRHIGHKKRPVILSTGMSTLDEVAAALEVLTGAGVPRHSITVLHANTEYPTPFEDVNLLAMQTMAKAFDVQVGYSDHTPGIEIPIAAVALGASVIEKHFTLDRNLPGPDHKASLQPDELRAMVLAIRHISVALGDGIKRCSPSETQNRLLVRKSLVAACPIAAGEIFTARNVTVKRPGTGISPMQWDSILGRPASRTYAEEELL